MATGLPLSTYVAPLRKVPVHLNARPSAAFDAMERIGPHARAYIASTFETDDFDRISHNLPMRAFARLSLDEIAKIRHSTSMMMDRSVEDAFDHEPNHVLVNKIASSMWRWGFSRGDWNGIVDAYDGLRSFDLGIEGLEVRLDHTTGRNECGYSEHSRIFLDGVFGLLVHHRGEHVMTIGLSVMGGRRLLLQQVQLRSRRGNRWLFRMPANRMEFVVDRLMSAFPRHAIHVADGADIAARSLRGYREGLAQAKASVARYAMRLAESSGDVRDVGEYLATAKESVAEYADKIAHLETEAPRIAALYRNTGRHAQGRALRLNGITHYRIES